MLKLSDCLIESAEILQTGDAQQLVKNDVILKMTPENRRKTFHN